LPERELLRAAKSRGVPWLEARSLPVLLPWVLDLVRTRLKITPESAQRSIERVRDVFRKVDERLRDGQRFLVGNRFTAADLTFASLAAPVLFPAGGRAAYPPLDVVPDGMREEVLRLRDTIAGQFALGLFAEERGNRASVQST
jgi:glutathione S-transferase